MCVKLVSVPVYSTARALVHDMRIHTYISGTTTSDTVYCVECQNKTCPFGEYLSNWCSGTTTTDAAFCARCSVTRCQEGEYIHDTCTGSTTSDSAVCKPCSTAGCPTRTYRPVCNGTAQGDPQCVRCTVGSCPLVSLPCE